MCEVRPLKPDSVKQMASRWAPQRIQRDWSVWYVGQVPNVAIFLESGNAEILRPDGTRSEIQSPALIGVQELVQQQSSNCTLVVKGDSRAGVLDRPTALRLNESI